MIKKKSTSLQVKLIIIILLFALCPLILVSSIFINSTKKTIISEQKTSSNKQLYMFNSNIDSMFEKMLNDVSGLTNDSLLKQTDNNITNFLDKNGHINMTPSKNGELERAIYQMFKKFGETHPNYQDVYMGTEFGGYLQYPEGNMDAPYDPRPRPWYHGALENPNEAILGEPFYWASEDTNYIGGSQALKDNNGNVIGVVALDMSLASVTELVEKAGQDTKGYFSIVDNKGTIIADPSNKENNFKKVDEVYGSEIGSLILSGIDYDEIKLNNRDYLIKSIKSEKTNWTYIALLDKESMLMPIRNLVKLEITLIGIISLLAVLIGVLISKKISKPIKEVSQAANEIADGNFYVEINTKATGEIGELVDSFKCIGVTLIQYKEYIEEISYILNHIADGNLNFELKQEYIGEFSKIKDSLLNISNNLSITIQNIKTSSSQIGLASNQVAAGAQMLAQGATEQASSVEELSATITEVSQHIKRNADNAQLANTEALFAGEEVRKSNSQMQQMKEAMNNINTKSAEISKIIKTIEDIAFQTNILALNAAVEAARAGSAGKGFAVVADEVRNLAQKSAQAAKNTTNLIAETVQAVEHGSRISESTAQSMLNVVEGYDKVLNLINEISNATKEQASAISQIVLGVDQISSVVQHNSATAEESAAASEELSGQAQLLNENIAQFKLKDKENSNLFKSINEQADTTMDLCRYQLDEESKY